MEYQERMSALGKFPGGYQRREGGSDHESLVAASVERAVAPHFPPGFLRSVQASLHSLMRPPASCMERHSPC